MSEEAARAMDEERISELRAGESGTTLGHPQRAGERQERQPSVEFLSTSFFAKLGVWATETFMPPQAGLPLTSAAPCAASYEYRTPTGDVHLTCSWSKPAPDGEQPVMVLTWTGDLQGVRELHALFVSCDTGLPLGDLHPLGSLRAGGYELLASDLGFDPTGQAWGVQLLLLK